MDEVYMVGQILPHWECGLEPCVVSSGRNKRSLNVVSVIWASCDMAKTDPLLTDMCCTARDVLFLKTCEHLCKNRSKEISSVIFKI